MANLEKSLVEEGQWLFLTGAGISAESGIPTFRGPEGYWQIGSRNYYPEELATRSAFDKMPYQVWAWYLFRRSVCRAAKPNTAHEMLVQLEKLLGDRFLLVTQNVDGLHVRAGQTPWVTYEIHGNIDRMRCFGECTNETFPVPDHFDHFSKGAEVALEDRPLLRCPKCQGLSRPHILWFDECYDEEHFRFASSRKAAQQCDALVTIGTSGNTNLPMQMGSLALANKAVCWDINPDHNPFSRVAQESGGEWIAKGASQGLAEIFRLFQPAE